MIRPKFMAKIMELLKVFAQKGEHSHQDGNIRSRKDFRIRNALPYALQCADPNEVWSFPSQQIRKWEVITLTISLKKLIAEIKHWPVGISLDPARTYVAHTANKKQKS